jgi:hypothetical protein
MVIFYVLFLHSLTSIMWWTVAQRTRSIHTWFLNINPVTFWITIRFNVCTTTHSDDKNLMTTPVKMTVDDGPLSFLDATSDDWWLNICRPGSATCSQVKVNAAHPWGRRKFGKPIRLGRDSSISTRRWRVRKTTSKRRRYPAGKRFAVCNEVGDVEEQQRRWQHSCGMPIKQERHFEMTREVSKLMGLYSTCPLGVNRNFFLIANPARILERIWPT